MSGGTTAFGASAGRRQARGFADRHIGTDAAAQALMLGALGYDSVDALVQAAVPASIHVKPRETSDIPPAATEAEALAELRELASQNRVARPMIGLGYYDTFTPSVISRNVLENPSWYTAYTPYQPEISQGRLEALINFQTMVTDLTGLATANASMLDEPTAVVEGMLVARRASKSASNVFAVDADALPQTKAVLRARAAVVGIELVELDFAHGATLPDELFGVFVQYPGASGRVWDPAGVIDAAHVAGGLAVVAADLLALTLLRSPGSLGADVAVGTTQRFGVPLGFGGPHAGYMAVRVGSRASAARPPGRRVAGCRRPPRLPPLAADARAAHPPREGDLEHLHRPGAAGRHGRDVRGLPRARRAPRRSRPRSRARRRRSPNGCARTACRSRRIPSSTRSASTTPGPSQRVIERARSRGYQLFWADDATVGVSVDETTTADDLAAVAWAFGLPAADEHGDRDCRVRGCRAPRRRDRRAAAR